jgi:hypothetical protein
MHNFDVSQKKNATNVARPFRSLQRCLLLILPKIDRDAASGPSRPSTSQQSRRAVYVLVVVVVVGGCNR